MGDWTGGYVTDVGYTFGYFSELNPLYAKIVLQDCNVACPEVQTACELGFGQGLSVNIHAAASTTQWYGTDFIPEQAAFAQKMAVVSGADARLFNDSFETFTKRKDLPDFDFIGLHGIWSWISNNNRRVIVNFLKKKLKPGGLLYISYNTLPGWADFVSLRHLMTRYIADMADTRRSRLEQISDSLVFFDRFLATKPRFAQVNPNIHNRLQSMHGKDTRYLAHEYFNREWYPMHFADMMQWFQDTDLGYVCSARYHHHIEDFNVSKEQGDFLREIVEPVFRESVYDFMINRQFRWDYWVKNARDMNKKERELIFQRQFYVMVVPISDVSLEVAGPLGKIYLDPEIYNPILGLMADYQPRTLRQIENELRSKSIKFPQIYRAIIVLLGKGCIEPAYGAEHMELVRAKTERINSFVRIHARRSDEIGVLASPLTGGGVSVNRIEQLFLESFTQGQTDPQQWAEYAWQQFSAVGSKVIKDGNILKAPEENLTELRSLASHFERNRLPILQALGIA